MKGYKTFQNLLDFLLVLKKDLCSWLRRVFRRNTETASSTTEKPQEGTSEDISGGKLTKIPEAIAKVTKAKRARWNGEVEMLPIQEEKLDELDLDFETLNMDSMALGNVMSKEVDDASNGQQ